MKQFTFEDVLSLTFDELGAIEDPMQLAATAQVSPMLGKRYFRHTLSATGVFRQDAAGRS